MKGDARKLALLACALPPATPAIGSEPTVPAFPVKPLRPIAPYPPGGGSDVMGRAIAERLAKQPGH